MLSRDASASKPGLLQHHTVVVPKALACQLLQRNIADFDRAAVHIIKTHQQLDQCSLSGSRRTYNGHLLSRMHLRRKIVDNDLIRIITKADVFKTDFPLRVLQLHRILNDLIFFLLPPGIPNTRSEAAAVD